MKPLLLYVHASNAAVLTRWRSHFKVVLQLSEITQDRQLSTASVAGWLKRQQVAGLYIQTHGAYSKGTTIRGLNLLDLPRYGVRLLVHAVFSALLPWPNATYARISACVPSLPSLNVPVVPYVVQPLGAASGPNLRRRLGLSSSQTVFCRHGGLNTFNIDFVRSAVCRVARERRDSVAFVFVNTRPVCRPAGPNIVHIHQIVDDELKAAFIRSCDAMLHARLEGETFGMAVAEFSALNKPVLTYMYPPEKARTHLDILGQKALAYTSETHLRHLLINFNRSFAAAVDWNAYREYAPGAVMAKFKRVFLR